MEICLRIRIITWRKRKKFLWLVRSISVLIYIEDNIIFHMQVWQLYIVYPFIMFYNFIFFLFSKVEIKFFEPDLI